MASEPGFFTYDEDGRRVVDRVRAEALAYFREREKIRGNPFRAER